MSNVLLLRKRYRAIRRRCRLAHWRRQKLAVDNLCWECHLKVLAARVAAIGAPIVMRHIDRSRDGD